MKLKYVIAAMSVTFSVITPVTTVAAQPVTSVAKAGATCRTHNRTTKTKVNGKTRRLTCLPATRGTRWTWQATPVNGHTCIKSGVIFKSLICKPVPGRWHWTTLSVTNPVPSGMSPTEVLDTIRPTLASWYADFIWTGQGQILQYRLATLGFKWAAYGLTVRAPNAVWLLAEISGSTFCLEMNPAVPAAFDTPC